MTTYYLAGPMTHRVNFNYDAFNECATKLRQAFPDAMVLNPAENFGGCQDLPYASYLERAKEQVLACDVVVLMRGWHRSNGVREELKLALEHEKGITTWEELMGYRGPENAFDFSVVTEDQKPTSAEEFAEANREWLTQPKITTAVPGGLFNEAIELIGDNLENLVDPTVAVGDYLTDTWSKDVPPIDPVVEGDGERIIDEAWDLVMGDREAAYGHPASDFMAMGRITASILSRWLESEDMVLMPRAALDKANSLRDLDLYAEQPLRFPDIEPRIVALIMTAVKISRLSAKHKHDSTTDLIGYAICEDRIAEGY